jgi:hypothetical protein
MSDRERLKRPELERTTPDRGWSGLFNGGRPGPAAEQPAARSGPSLEDVVSRSVDLGYRVVNEYVRQGQKAARRLSEGSYGAETWTTDAQDLAGRMAQYASELVGTWFELMQLTVGPAGLGRAVPGRPADRAASGPQASASAAAQPSTETPAPAAATTGGRFRVQIVSLRPVEVVADLRPDAAQRPLRVHALRTTDPTKPRLTQVTFHSNEAGEPPTLQVRVPDDQPPGAYEGVVLDSDTNRPVGIVRVTIADERG